MTRGFVKDWIHLGGTGEVKNYLTGVTGIVTPAADMLAWETAIELCLCTELLHSDVANVESSADD